MDCSTPGFLVLHHHPELAQTHVHWVDDAIQPYPVLIWKFKSRVLPGSCIFWASPLGTTWLLPAGITPVLASRTSHLAGGARGKGALHSLSSVLPFCGVNLLLPWWTFCSLWVLASSQVLVFWVPVWGNKFLYWSWFLVTEVIPIPSHLWW